MLSSVSMLPKYGLGYMLIRRVNLDINCAQQVQFILSGEADETDVRGLADESRKILRRGANDFFLMSVPRLVNRRSRSMASIDPLRFSEFCSCDRLILRNLLPSLVPFENVWSLPDACLCSLFDDGDILVGVKLVTSSRQQSSCDSVCSPRSQLTYACSQCSHGSSPICYPLFYRHLHTHRTTILNNWKHGRRCNMFSFCGFSMHSLLYDMASIADL